MIELALTDYRNLIDSLKFCVIVHEADSKGILWANQAACEFLGFTLEELKRLTVADISGRAPGYSCDMGRAGPQRALEHGVNSIKWCARTRAGEEIMTEATAIRVKLPSQTVVLSQFRDMVREKENQRDPFRSEGWMRVFLRNMVEGIVLLDELARVEYASESAARLLHTDVSRMVGTDFRDYCDPATRQALNEQLSTTPSQGGPVDRSRYRLVGADGNARWYSARCQYLDIDIDSDVRGHLLLFHDITDRVEDEETHRRDMARLDYLTRYNAMGNMAMAIAHEVAQPLAAAYNFLEGARGSNDPDWVEQGLGGAKAQIERANQILASLRQFVAQFEQSTRPADLNDIVEECRHLLDVHARANCVDLQLYLCAGALPVLCERVLIGQVVLNLGFNAIDEMAGWPAGQRSVEIRTRTMGASAQLAVLDRGHGLSAFPGGRVFDGDFTSKPHGSGLGLALSQRIIMAHGGQISARENTPRGAVLAFQLPLLYRPCR